jgi:hypothetical protein
MSDNLKKLVRVDLRRLKPGDSVAWSVSHWGQPGQPDFSFHEGQVLAHPVRSAQEVTVLFNGIAHAVHKNQLYNVPPVIDVEDMHTEYDYNS